MIVQEPPYDLVALFSDLDMEKLLEQLIERGQDRRGCLRSLRWRSLRHPGRDQVWQAPQETLRPFVAPGTCFILAWDHAGSGGERETPERAESVAARRVVEGLGVTADRVLAVAFSPEVECLLKPIWTRVKEVVAQKRRVQTPDDSEILARLRALPRRAVHRMEPDESFQDALARYPKEIFEALLLTLQLRRAPPLYAEIGRSVSLLMVKRESPAARIATFLRSWFPLAP